MTAPRVLTLLSDFGDRDIYVGVMKGVIAGINPGLNVVDLTHQIPPQDIVAARFNLMNAYAFFPPNAVHVAVVDPEVGSQRRAIAIATAHGCFVAPDNGLLSGVWLHTPILSAVALTHPHFWYTPTPSQTFHGRDIFAAVGAHLASGVDLEQLGSPLDPTTLIQLEIPQCQRIGTKIVGAIQYIDHFGNLVTNIPAAALDERDWQIRLPSEPAPIPGLSRYHQVSLGAAIAVIGSHGWVELAINQGNARQHWNVIIGMPVELELIASF
jgi:S-adenosyl-L-methionine hydrolase (adenosine-forming)